MGFATVIAAATFSLILFRSDPATASATEYLLLFAGLFLTIAGILSIFGFLIRVRLYPQELLTTLVSGAFRQGLLFSGLLVGALALLSRGLLSWWNALFLVVLATGIEYFFLHRARKTLIH